jgi:hypothetical protein
MVRALLAGTKTQTRRIVKPSVKGCTVGAISSASIVEPVNVDEDGGPWDSIKCPYGALGDHLWVRETFCQLRLGDWEQGMGMGVLYNTYGPPRRNGFSYRADQRPGDTDSERCRKELGYDWTPSIHMPRIASRLTLEITEVCVQRLDEISREDAKAEGLSFVGDGGAGYGVPGIASSWSGNPFDSYRELWNSINGAGSWDMNPWVWALTFKQVTA